VFGGHFDDVFANDKGLWADKVKFCPFVGDGADGYQVDADAGNI
jgi:hypothetical protein